MLVEVAAVKNLLDTQCSEAEETRNALKNDLLKYKTRLQEANAKIELLEVLDDDNMELRQRIKVLQKERGANNVVDTQAKIKELQTQNNRLQEIVQEKSNQLMLLENIKNENKRLSHKILDQENIGPKNTSEVDSELEKKVKHYEYVQDQQNEIIKSLRDEIGSMIHKQNDLHTDRKNLSDKLSNLVDENSTLSLENKTLEQAKETLSKQNDEFIKDKLEQMKNTEVNANMKKEYAQSEIKLLTENDSLVNVNTGLMKEKEDLLRDKDDLTDRVTKLTLQCDAHYQQVDEAKKLHVSTLRYRDCELATLKKEVDESKQQLVKLREDKTSLQSTIVSLDTDRVNLITKTESLELQEVALKDQLKEAESRARDSETDTKTLEKLKEDLKQLKASNQILQKEMVAVREARSVEVFDVSKLRSQVAMLQIEKQNKDEEIISLQLEVKKVISNSVMPSVGVVPPTPDAAALKSKSILEEQDCKASLRTELGLNQQSGDDTEVVNNSPPRVSTDALSSQSNLRKTRSTAPAATSTATNSTVSRQFSANKCLV